MTFSDWMYHTRALLKKHVNYASSSLIVNFFKGVKKKSPTTNQEAIHHYSKELLCKQSSATFRSYSFVLVFIQSLSHFYFIFCPKLPTNYLLDTLPKWTKRGGKREYLLLGFTKSDGSCIIVNLLWQVQIYVSNVHSAISDFGCDIH